MQKTFVIPPPPWIQYASKYFIKLETKLYYRWRRKNINLKPQRRILLNYYTRRRWGGVSKMKWWLILKPGQYEEFDSLHPVPTQSWPAVSSQSPLALTQIVWLFPFSPCTIASYRQTGIIEMAWIKILFELIKLYNENLII